MLVGNERQRRMVEGRLIRIDTSLLSLKNMVLQSQNWNWTL